MSKGYCPVEDCRYHDQVPRSYQTGCSNSMFEEMEDDLRLMQITTAARWTPELGWHYPHDPDNCYYDVEPGDYYGPGDPYNDPAQV